MRNDLFPKMIGFFLESKEKIIERWVDEAFSALVSLFPAKEDFIVYINSIKDPKDAELLIRLSQFYLIAKKYQQESYVKLIMVVSAIEKIANKEKGFQEFYHWIEGQDSKIGELLSRMKNIDVSKFKEIIRTLRESYFQEYGSRRNVSTFFREHLTQEDKTKLIRSMKANWTDVVQWYSDRNPLIKFLGRDKIASIQELKGKYRVEKHLVPYCYNWKKCYFDGIDCAPHLGCLLTENSNFQDETLKKVVDDIYQMRSDFIHNAIITPLNERDAVTLGTIGGKPVSIDLTSEELQNMFEKALKHFFDQLVS